MTSVVRLKPSALADAAQVGRDRVAASHRLEHAVVARLERNVQVARNRRRLPHGGDEPVVEMIDLDGREPKPGQPGNGADRADQARQVVTGLAVAVAPEVDPREDDLAVPLRHAAPHLAEDGRSRPAARGPAHLRDHAEAAREAAAVLHLDERADAVEPCLVVDAADRPDVAGDEGSGALARERDDRDVVRQPLESGAEIRGASGHVHLARPPRSPACRLARLANGLVRHAAGVEHRDVRGGPGLHMPVANKPLADLLRIRMRHLAAQEIHRKRGHDRRDASAMLPTRA